MPPAVLFILLTLASPVRSNWLRNDEEAEILKKIFETYNPAISPAEPVNVTVNMHITNLHLVDDAPGHETHLIGDGYFAESWIDPRLKFHDAGTKKIALPNLGLSGKEMLNVERLWLPNTHFSNELQAKPIERSKTDRYSYISSHGRVGLCVRFRNTFKCATNHGSYPFGNQECTINIESFSTTYDRLHYRWGTVGLSIAENAIATSTGYRLATWAGTNRTEHVEDRMFLALVAKISFRRMYTSQDVAELFAAPATMVVTSWATFILPEWRTQGILPLVLLLAAYNVMLPAIMSNHPLVKFSYTHFYLTGCLGFLLAELIALVALLLLAKYRPGHEAEKPDGDDDGVPESVSDKFGLIQKFLPHNNDDKVVAMLRLGVVASFALIFLVWSLAFAGTM